jgi:protein-tyrosine phosphatase
MEINSEQQSTQQDSNNDPLANPRILSFQGISNFRDLGGYSTQENRRVKRGLLYRSGHLARSTQKDQQKLIDLGIGTVIDFRSDQERSREPNRLPPEQEIQVIPIPIQQNKQAPFTDEIRSLIKDRALNEFDPSKKMTEMYIMLASNYTEEYQKFFRILLESDGKPLLWHCSAGKDRAGFVTALLLKILGVREDIILQDYLLSQGNVERRMLQLVSVGLLRGIKAARFIQGLYEVDLDWLLTSFRTIEGQWGSFEVFTSEGLQIGLRERDHLKSIYLE